MGQWGLPECYINAMDITELHLLCLHRAIHEMQATSGHETEPNTWLDTMLDGGVLISFAVPQ